MIRENLIRIGKLARNNFHDENTGKVVGEDELMDMLEYFDDNVGFDSALDVILEPEGFGYNKDASVEELVDALLAKKGE